MLLNEKDQNLSVSPKEGWGAYQDIIVLTAKCRITGTWVYTCDFSHLAVAVHLFPFPNPKKMVALRPVSHACSTWNMTLNNVFLPFTGNSLVDPATLPSSFVAI